jgi:ribosomal protein S18 acetylase RimI-like enzyme
MSSPAPAIREGRPDEAHLLAEAFREMWLDNAIAEPDIEPDYRERVERFVVAGRERAHLRFYLAERDEELVGAACCQLFEGLYPAILKSSLRRYGYIWGVYVARHERRQGLGRRLTDACVQALVELDCTHVVLHAAPPGKGVYAALGFVGTNEMRLTLPSSR